MAENQGKRSDDWRLALEGHPLLSREEVFAVHLKEIARANVQLGIV